MLMFAFLYRVAASLTLAAPFRRWLRERARAETMADCDSFFREWQWSSRKTEMLSHLRLRVASAEWLTLEERETFYTRIEMALSHPRLRLIGPS